MAVVGLQRDRAARVWDFPCILLCMYVCVSTPGQGANTRIGSVACVWCMWWSGGGGLHPVIFIMMNTLNQNSTHIPWCAPMCMPYISYAHIDLFAGHSAFRTARSGGTGGAGYHVRVTGGDGEEVRVAQSIKPHEILDNLFDQTMACHEVGILCFDIGLRSRDCQNKRGHAKVLVWLLDLGRFLFWGPHCFALVLFTCVGKEMTHIPM